MFLMDREFECMRDSLPEEANLNNTSTNEHVPDIERNNHVINELARALIRNFPFNKIPGRIIIELIRFVGLWLNKQPLGKWGIGCLFSTKYNHGQRSCL